MTFSISGRREHTTSGGSSEGAATQNLRVQIPLIEREFSEIQGCYCGTINLRLPRNLIIAEPDYRTTPIPWHPEHAPGEVFDFLRIKLEAPEEREQVDAWIYIAHDSEHRRDPTMHEILASEYCDLSESARCRIHISRNVIELPYRANPTLVVV